MEAEKWLELENGNLFLVKTVESRLKVIEVLSLMQDYISASKLVEKLLIDMKNTKEKGLLTLNPNLLTHFLLVVTHVLLKSN